ncbi:hypothetical protein NS228_10400 [Methylobacterium indicum]|uniref:Lipoprotein n=1 Tax=Methylobacterium indicum TaxID=1775910 RepID=A0A8H8WR59_9HYPH|nr:hypothetical protein [Methylobacterium indicum]KTS32287.1 hypothetical protein NS229_12990 [Methylobacterium indicum]KTS40569.1 hypothetical protein NS228_10400 [Methylobacterium indicum]KTS47894.1 hypothetical protein NS230_20225 [Methylobacterium indicum]BCM82856.1 hypothetical protein mvi_13170 [Methylobacterium indicum]
MPPLARLASVLLLLAAGTVPAFAISDRRDQPTQADLPRNDLPHADPPDGTRAGDSGVAPPQALKPETQVTPSQAPPGGTPARTNPLDKLDPKDRRATGGGDGSGDRR